jgi:hypothetical protein
MTHVSHVRLLHRIREYLEEVDLDVVCVKQKNSYLICWDDDGQPLAKLRPTGRGDYVEVYYWDENRWESTTESGLVLPLEKALEYITDDPDNVFFEADDSDDGDSEEVSSEFAAMVHELRNGVHLCVLLGGVVGGLFAGVVAGGAWGALAGAVCSLPRRRSQWHVRILLSYLVLLCTPMALLAGAVGVLGSAVHGAVAHGVWGPICGVLAGAFFCCCICAGGWMTRSAGFAAGFLLAVRLMELFQLRDHFVGLALIAIAACASAGIYGVLGRYVLEPMNRVQ